MQISVRMLALGLVLELGTVAVHAQPKASDGNTTGRAVLQPPVPLDLTPPAIPLDQSPPGIPQDLMPLAAPQSPVVDKLQGASPEVRSVALWVNGSRDNAGLPYVLVDKVNAEVFVFDKSGRLQAKAPVLLGMGRGDRLLVPNEAPMSAMPPEKRITPAGRFVSRLAIDSQGKELLVIDYDASISLHPVLKGTPAERRAERLASPTSQDNRISFGCINVPTSFYSAVVSPAFTNTKGIVYILPETLPAGELFGFQPGADATPGAQSSMGALSQATAGAE